MNTIIHVFVIYITDRTEKYISDFLKHFLQCGCVRLRSWYLKYLTLPPHGIAISALRFLQYYI